MYSGSLSLLLLDTHHSKRERVAIWGGHVGSHVKQQAQAASAPTGGGVSDTEESGGLGGRGLAAVEHLRGPLSHAAVLHRFMDGATLEWITTARQRNAEFLVRRKARRSGRDAIFGYHMHSLVAVSRVEVCVVPLREVAKCLVLFHRLLDLAAKKYPALAESDEELLKRRASADMHALSSVHALLAAQKEGLRRSGPPQMQSLMMSYLSKDDFESKRTQQRLKFVVQC